MNPDQHGCEKMIIPNSCSGHLEESEYIYEYSALKDVRSLKRNEKNIDFVD